MVKKFAQVVPRAPLAFGAGDGRRLMNAAYRAVWGRWLVALALAALVVGGGLSRPASAFEMGAFERLGSDDETGAQSESGTPAQEEDERAPGDGRPGDEGAAPRAGEPSEDDGPAGCIFDNRPLELLV